LAAAAGALWADRRSRLNGDKAEGAWTEINHLDLEAEPWLPQAFLAFCEICEGIGLSQVKSSQVAFNEQVTIAPVLQK